MIVTLGVSILATNLLNLFRIFSNKHLESMDNINQPSKNVEEILNEIVKVYFNDEVTKEDIKDTITKIHKDHNDNPDFNNIDLVQLKLDKLQELSLVNKNIDSIKSQIKNLNKSELEYLLKVSNFYTKFIKSYISKSDNQENKQKLEDYLEDLNTFTITIQDNINNLSKQQDTKDTSLPSNSDTVTIASTSESQDSDDKLLDSSTPSTAPLTTSATPQTTLSTGQECPKGFTLDKNKGVCVQKEAMTSLNPAAISSKDSSSNNNIDDAKIKETAYDNLERIFSSDKVRSVANETNSLHQRQNKIMDQLKDIGPLMQQAMSLIKNVDMDAINNVSNKMTGMIDKLQTMKTDIQ